MSEYTPDDEEYSTYALLNGKLESVEDIIDAVEQEQDHDERFLSYRILIAELKRCYEKIDKMDEAILSARELLMSYFDAVTLSDDEAAQEILDVVKELRKASE